MGGEIASLYAVIGAEIDGFMGGMGKVKSALGGMSDTLKDVGRDMTTLFTLPILGGLAATVVSAAKSETAIAQLDAALKSTSRSAIQAATSQGYWSASTALSGREVAKLEGQIKSQNNAISDQILKNQIAGTTTKAAANAVAFHQAKIGQLNDELKKGTAIQKVWVNAQQGVSQVLQMSRDALLKMATALQNTTRFSDDAIISAEAMLLTFTKVGRDVFPQATEAILDMSTAMHQDLQSSAIQIGKALNDPIAGLTALRRVGVTFSAAQERVIRNLVNTNQLAKAQKVILQELQTEFGGSAKAAGETFAGKLEILKNKFDDLLEALGTPINNGLKPFIDSLSSGLGDLTRIIASADPAMIQMAAAIGVALAAIGPLALALGALISPAGLVVVAIGALGLAFATNFGGITDTVKNLAKAIGPDLAKIGGIVKDFTKDLFPETTLVPHVGMHANPFAGQWLGNHRQPGMVKNRAPDPEELTGVKDSPFGDRLKTAIDNAWPKLKEALDSIWKKAEPIVTEGLKNLGDALGKTFGDAIRGAIGSGITTLMKLTVSFLTGAVFIDAIKGAWNAVVDWFNGSGKNSMMGAINSLAEEIRKTLGNVFQPLLDAANNVIEELKKLLPKESSSVPQPMVDAASDALKTIMADKVTVNAGTVSLASALQGNMVPPGGVPMTGGGGASFGGPEGTRGGGGGGRLSLNARWLKPEDVFPSGDEIAPVASESFSRAMETMKPPDLTGAMTTAITSAVTWLGTTGKDLFGKGMQSLADAATSTLTPIMGPVYNSLTNVVDWLKNAALKQVKVAFQGMVDAVGGILKGIAAPIVASVIAALGALAKLLRSIPGNLGTGAADAIDSAIGARASGGPVSGGMPYIVGERGPELFMPGASGSIVPNHALRGGGSSSSGGGNIVINGPIIINGAQDAGGFLDRLEMEARRRNMVLQKPISA